MSLELIDSKKEFKKIDKPYLYTLKIDKGGIYFVDITARAKSHGQNHSFNKQADDELSVQIDESKDFTNEKAAIWNGNELKNLQKTVVFITYLEKGLYQWSLIPKNKPFLGQINTYRIQDEKVTFIPTINNPSEDGDRRPWHSFILVNIGLNKLTVHAKAKKQFFSFDDDDLKIIIDGGKVFNESKKSHNEWFWCGKILKGKSKEFTREFPTNTSRKSIEFYSDRTPLLEEISFEFDKPFQLLPPMSPKIQVYDKTDQNDYNRFDNEIVKAVEDWNNIFTKQEYPVEKTLDPNLIKAMIYIETRMGYGAGSNQAYPDVMQVADERNPAIHTLNNDGWVDPKTGKIARESEFVSHQDFKAIDYKGKVNGNTSEQSIYWGVRWLFHKAQRFYGTGPKGNIDPPYVREWKTWEQAVIDYNDSGTKIEYQASVWQLYKKGIDPQRERLW